jgi:CheY-like chemotaxis protein
MNQQQIGALHASRDEGHTTLKFSKETPTMSSTYKILVIEDSPVLRDSIAVWLDFSGYSVVVANDGFEGLAVLSKELPDLIVTDIAMPRLNGIEMIRSVRQLQCRLGRVPIIVLTGSFTDYASEALSAGADRALEKPVEPKLMLAHVRSLLNQGPAVFRAAS